MSTALLIDEATREVIETCSKYGAESRAREIAGQSARAILVCTVTARITSVTELKVDTDHYPDGVFGQLEIKEAA